MNSQVTELARKEGELQSLRAQQAESREQVNMHKEFVMHVQCVYCV